MSIACLNCDQPFMDGRQIYCDIECRVAYHLSQGKCPKHPSQSILPGTKRCQKCKERLNKRYLTIKAKDYCLICGKSRYPGSNQFCKPCHIERKKYNQTRSIRLSQEGLCISCGKNPRYDYAHCEPCRLKKYNRRQIKNSKSIVEQLPIHLQSIHHHQ